MDTGAIERVQYDCDKSKRQVRRMILIVLLPCVSSGIFVAMAIVLIKRYKRNKQYRRLREHIYMIHENHLRYSFPVFLSCASEDSEFVGPNIIQPLKVSVCITLSAILNSKFPIFVKYLTNLSFEYLYDQKILRNIILK